MPPSWAISASDFQSTIVTDVVRSDGGREGRDERGQDDSRRERQEGRRKLYTGHVRAGRSSVKLARKRKLGLLREASEQESPSFRRPPPTLVDSALLPPDLPDAPPRAVRVSMCAGLAVRLDV